MRALVEDFSEGNHRYKGAHVFFTEGTYDIVTLVAIISYVIHINFGFDL